MRAIWRTPSAGHRRAQDVIGPRFALASRSSAIAPVGGGRSCRSQGPIARGAVSLSGQEGGTSCSPMLKDSDFVLLRRKGRLKEQDPLIDFMISMHNTRSPLEVCEKMEELIAEHIQDGEHSTLLKLVPTVGNFRSELPLTSALVEYDAFSSICNRKYVPPNFAEIRHVLNIAQIHAIASNLELATFDADGTIYDDGKTLSEECEMVGLILGLLRRQVKVAIITAAGYPGEPEKFEHRFKGLLRAFESLQVPKEILQRFYIMGGECNYLLQINNGYRLEFIPREDWMSQALLSLDERGIAEMLDMAQSCLLAAASRLRLPVDVVRKERSVGVIPKAPTNYEALEEMALSVTRKLSSSSPVPFCAFNGGADTFVDVGNKGLGLEALLDYLGCRQDRVIHVGDRFTATGNDVITKRKFATLWVANPRETEWFIKLLLTDLNRRDLLTDLESKYAPG